MEVKILTANSKTVASLDLNRERTCGSICSYCYVHNTERQYPDYKKKIIRNAIAAELNPVAFARNINKEVAFIRRSKAKEWHLNWKLPIRLYGAGDYVPGHFSMLEAFDFGWYMYSKNLTHGSFDVVEKIAELPNCRLINLSYDSGNINTIYNFPPELPSNVQRVFTGTPDEWEKLPGMTKVMIKVWYNTGDTAEEKLRARVYRQACACDTGVLDHNRACTFCNRCHGGRI